MKTHFKRPYNRTGGKYYNNIEGDNVSDVVDQQAFYNLKAMHEKFLD